MKMGRISGILVATLFLVGIAVSVYAAKAPIVSDLDSYGYQWGGSAEERDTEFMHQEEFAWTPNYVSPSGIATIAENEIRIDAKGLPGNCEFRAYLVDPVNMKVYGLGDKDYTFKSDENGNGNFTFETPIKSGYDALPMTDLRDWSWKTIDIQMKPGCVGYNESPDKVLALDLDSALN